MNRILKRANELQCTAEKQFLVWCDENACMGVSGKAKRRGKDIKIEYLFGAKKYLSNKYTNEYYNIRDLVIAQLILDKVGYDIRSTIKLIDFKSHIPVNAMIMNEVIMYFFYTLITTTINDYNKKYFDVDFDEEKPTQLDNFYKYLFEYKYIVGVNKRNYDIPELSKWELSYIRLAADLTKLLSFFHVKIDGKNCIEHMVSTINNAMYCDRYIIDGLININPIFGSLLAMISTTEGDIPAIEIALFLKYIYNVDLFPELNKISLPQEYKYLTTLFKKIGNLSAEKVRFEEIEASNLSRTAEPLYYPRPRVF